ncbi:MAG: hypothetical protein ABFD89_18535 [Bryobacteraceae bacterium]
MTNQGDPDRLLHTLEQAQARCLPCVPLDAATLRYRAARERNERELREMSLPNKEQSA